MVQTIGYPDFAPEEDLRLQLGLAADFYAECRFDFLSNPAEGAVIDSNHSLGPQEVILVGVFRDGEFASGKYCLLTRCHTVGSVVNLKGDIATEESGGKNTSAGIGKDIEIGACDLHRGSIGFHIERVFLV